MSLFGQKGLAPCPSRRSQASLVRTSISGSTRDHVSYVFDTAVITEKLPIRCHNPLNVGISIYLEEPAESSESSTTVKVL
jgi:hypothetical protein